ncbi:MAG: Mut7-C RNAse domain-containing protein [Caldilineales bacterium]|nr:Mut7-C RNAse domain-containing protein [Caldilineales bacterium]
MPKPQAKAPPLLIDAMLGTLARRLRWLGYDAEYRNDLPDEEMIAIANESGRVLVTRDRVLAGRRGLSSLFIVSQELEEQVQAVVDTLGLAHAPARCTACNGDLDPLTVQQAMPLVPPYVARTQTEFVQYRRCARVYWPGSHWPALQAWRQISQE